VSVTTVRPATREIVSHSFSFGDAAQTIWTMPADGRVLSASVSIRTAFDASGSAVEIGVSGDADAIFGAADASPTVAGEYEVDADYDLDAGETVRLALTPNGSVQGSGVVTLVVAFY
jgi:hypothetical protein